MADDRYVSRFDLPSFILIIGFSLGADILNFVTFFVAGAMWTVVLRLIFALMGVKNAVVGKMFIGFFSTTVYTIAVYSVEKAKESSPSLAKADSIASAATSTKPPGV